MNNRTNDAVGRYEIQTVTIETVDAALFDYFDKKLNISVDVESGRKKVPIIYAAGERWAMIRDKKGLRDENGTLILPLITIRRVNVDRTRGFGGYGTEVNSITVSSDYHKKNSNFQNLLETRRQNGFPTEKKDKQIKEFLTIPFPDFCIFYYEVIIWSQYQSQMNEILEKIFYNYEIMDSFVMPVNYDGNKPKGDGYYFVGFRDGTVASQSNMEEFTNQERIIKYSYNIKVPVYLILDPKDETLAYGRNMGESSKDDGSKVVYKHQNAIDIGIKESVISREDFKKLFG